MNKEKFTSGPWILDNNSGWRIMAEIEKLKEYKDSEQRYPIWTIPSELSMVPSNKPQQIIGYEPWAQFPPKWWIEMSSANAQLISAAPDMYKALSEILTIVALINAPLDKNILTIITLCERAIVKAEGMEKE